MTEQKERKMGVRMSKFTKGGKMGVRMNISPKGDYDDDADGKNGS